MNKVLITSDLTYYWTVRSVKEKNMGAKWEPFEGTLKGLREPFKW